MYLASKLLPLFVLPLGVSLILLGWGLVRGRRRVAAAGLILLLASSNPMLSRQLVRAAEGGAERRAAAQMPQGRAIVVLSAGRSIAPGPEHATQWGESNRFFGGLELYRAGKAPLLVFTGGASPWSTGPFEGEELAAEAIASGVPRDAIAVTPKVVNTAGEAAAVAELLRARAPGTAPVLLVTSAMHMPRASLLFERQGLQIERFPVAFAATGGGPLVFDFFPSPTALRNSEDSLREFYGRIYYWRH
jgi:uncharacterized SAM-binding protein YcdF (DUF218 family)